MIHTQPSDLCVRAAVVQLFPTLGDDLTGEAIRILQHRKTFQSQLGLHSDRNDS